MDDDLEGINRIERSIEISAPLPRVWDLVTEPGWWVDDVHGTVGDRTPGAVTLRDSETYGVFPVQVITMRPMTYAAFRWASQFSGSEHLVPEQTTLVEFTLTPVGDAVRVTVVETGFASIEASRAERESAFRENSSGWEEMLAVLAKRAS